jgi:hypothetical protein
MESGRRGISVVVVAGRMTMTRGVLLLGLMNSTVEDEDEEQMAMQQQQQEGDGDEERWRRRVELARPRTPEPTGWVMTHYLPLETTKNHANNRAHLT